MGQPRSIVASLVSTLVASILLWSLVPAGTSHAALARKIAKPKPPHAPVKCEMSKFRIIVDVGHTPDSYGALAHATTRSSASTSGLQSLITAKLKAEGFAATRLLVTDGKARPSLFKRVSTANDARADSSCRSITIRCRTN